MHYSTSYVTKGLDVIMARITLIRHGKAEMPRIGGNDFDRGLIQRGMQNAEAVGQFMQAHRMLPDLVLVSPAARTRQTYELMAANWPNPPSVIYEDKLYEVSADTLLRLIFEHGRDVETLAVVGHNPSLVVLLNHMVGDGHAEQNLGYFPTCCTADIGFVAPKICDIISDEGRLLSIKRARDL